MTVYYDDSYGVVEFFFWAFCYFTDGLGVDYFTILVIVLLFLCDSDVLLTTAPSDFIDIPPNTVLLRTGYIANSELRSWSLYSLIYRLLILGFSVMVCRLLVFKTLWLISSILFCICWTFLLLPWMTLVVAIVPIPGLLPPVFLNKMLVLLRELVWLFFGLRIWIYFDILWSGVLNLIALSRIGWSARRI